MSRSQGMQKEKGVALKLCKLHSSEGEWSRWIQTSEDMLSLISARDS